MSQSLSTSSQVLTQHKQVDASETITVSGKKIGRPTEMALELYQHHDMILRDYLATDRTIMSNEQSLLAYIRTGLSMAAAGAVLTQVGSNPAAWIGGAALIGASVVVVILGFYKFRKMQKVLDAVVRNRRRDDPE